MSRTEIINVLVMNKSTTFVHYRNLVVTCGRQCFGLPLRPDWIYISEMKTQCLVLLC